MSTNTSLKESNIVQSAPSTQETSHQKTNCAEIQTEDLLTKIVEERNKNEEIKKQLTLEKARADRLQKKVQFIQDNQDLFNQLKEAYSTLKLAKGTITQIKPTPTINSEVQVEVERQLQDNASQTTTIELQKNTHITVVSKKDLAEVSQLIQELKQVVTRGGNRVVSAIEKEHSRSVEDKKQVEVENIHLKRELYHKSSELERLRASAGSGPREITLLRRIITKLINSGNDLSCLSSREASLAKYLAQKYELKYLQAEKNNLAIEPDESPEKVVAITPYDSFDAMETANYLTPRTPQTPLSPEFYTPRWNKGDDVP